MSIRKTYDLECDWQRCSGVFHGVTARQGERRLPARDTRRLAAKQGWSTRRLDGQEVSTGGGGLDFCPEHTQKLADGEQMRLDSRAS